MRIAGLILCGFCAGALSACGQFNDTIVVRDKHQVENRGADKDNWWDKLPRPEWRRYERVLSELTWFEVYQVLDGIYAIYEPGQFEEVVSFLIEGEDRALLFDSGLGIGNIREVVAALTDLELVVLNSHTHYDHVGGNYQFDHILGRDTEFTRQSASGRSHKEVAEFVGPGWVWKDWPQGFEPKNYRSRPFVISEVVDEGETIDLGGRILEVLVTPGHAPDALCLIDRENRLLLTGDTFYLAPLYTHLAGSDFEQYRESAARLAALAGEVDAVLTAHNVPVVDGAYLTKLGDAFERIAAGRGDFVLTDGNREYGFGDFSVIVREDILH